MDTTGSSPVPVDVRGKPLALLNQFKNEPLAMFALWCDQTATSEAELINSYDRRSKGAFTKYCGGAYSAEWFWSKLLYLLNHADRELASAVHSFVEHSDYIPWLLSGENLPIKRNICSAGHKSLWHPSFGGLPGKFLKRVSPKLIGFMNIYSDVVSAGTPVGRLCSEWAKKLGLPENIPISAGILDAHAAAVGSGVRPGILCQIIGTSACDMVVAPKNVICKKGKEESIRGISGQVFGSIIPGLYGLEAGQSAFGSIYADLYRLFQDFSPNSAISRDAFFAKIESDADDVMRYPNSIPFSVPWHAGRRSGGADQTLSGAIYRLGLGLSLPQLYSALVFGSCYESRRIIEMFTSQGIKIDRLVACGGASKSDFIMQAMSDASGLPISVSGSEQTAALGSAMFAAVAGGAFPDVLSAQSAMMSGRCKRFIPRKRFAEAHKERYMRYLKDQEVLEQVLHS